MRLPTLFLIPFLALPAFAQNEEVPAIPGIVPPAPVAAVPAPAEAANLGDTLIVEDIEQLKLSGNDLAALYRKYTGRRVIVMSAAAQAEFQFIQPASPQDPLTYAQAAELLKKAATSKNFVFIPDPTEPNLDILAPAPAFTENDPLPEGDAVISYVMKLSFIKPDEAVRTFTQIIGQFSAFGSIAAVPNADSVVITENTALIRKLIDLKAEIDKPSSQVATRFITVKHADVTELAATLNELLGETSPDQKDTPVQIIPDPRTNRIFAMGRPVDLLFVEGLVREFDTQSDQRNFLRRKLKFLAAADFLPIAGDALKRALSGTGTAEAPSQRQPAVGSAPFDPQDINSAPESLLIGRTLLVADKITNCIVVQGPPSALELIEKLLDQVDVKPDQVMISAVFAQLSLGKSTSTGLDWLRAFRPLGNGGKAGTYPSLSGLSLYGRIESPLAAYVNLLSTSDDFTVLSRPSIFADNNQKGTISSGHRITIPTSRNGVSGNIEYRDVLLKLEVIPLVNSGDEITLQIALISDDVIGNTPIEGVGVGTREYVTTVTVPNNQTIVLGGLISTKGGDRGELMIFIQPSIVNSANSLDYVQADMDSRYNVSGQLSQGNLASTGVDLPLAFLGSDLSLKSMSALEKKLLAMLLFAGFVILNFSLYTLYALRKARHASALETAKTDLGQAITITIGESAEQPAEEMEWLAANEPPPAPSSSPAPVTAPQGGRRNARSNRRL